MEKYTGSEGLDAANFLKLVEAYTNPCIDLLKALCEEKPLPYTCPSTISLFFRSIRKSVCPAISITPKQLWIDLRLYLNSGNESILKSLVSGFNILKLH